MPTWIKGTMAAKVPETVDEIIKLRPKQFGGYKFHPLEIDRLEDEGFQRSNDGTWFDTKQIPH